MLMVPPIIFPALEKCLYELSFGWVALGVAWEGMPWHGLASDWHEIYMWVSHFVSIIFWCLERS